MAAPPPHDPDEVQRQAQQSLEELSKPGPTVLGSSLVDAANRARAHFSATEADQNDEVEVWGRRIARIAAVIAVVWLIYSLVGDVLGRH